MCRMCRCHIVCLVLISSRAFQKKKVFCFFSSQKCFSTRLTWNTSLSVKTFKNAEGVSKVGGKKMKKKLSWTLRLNSGRGREIWEVLTCVDAVTCVCESSHVCVCVWVVSHGTTTPSFWLVQKKKFGDFFWAAVRNGKNVFSRLINEHPTWTECCYRVMLVL